SDFVPVTPGRRLQIKPSIGLTAIYDNELNFIQMAKTSEFPYLLPPGAAYIRTQMSKFSLDDKYIYMGTEDMPYYPYGEGPGTSGGGSAQKELKILGLGNSYTIDTFWMLKDIAESAGYNVTVGISHLSRGTITH